MRIGEVAALCKVEAHVLRHWEAMQVVVPSRRHNGHREYSDEQILQIGLVRIGKLAGLSLDQIRQALHGLPEDRARVIAEQNQLLAIREREVNTARRVLSHASDCPLGVNTTCQECDSLLQELGA